MKRGNQKSLKNLKPFQPGVSGNPKGAPKGKRWRTVIAEFMEAKAFIGAKQPAEKELLEQLSKHVGRQLTNRDVVVFKQMLLAHTNPTAARIIMDREEGRSGVETEDLGGGETYLDFLDRVDD